MGSGTAWIVPNKTRPVFLTAQNTARCAIRSFVEVDCIPSCEGKTCGDDLCGGSCGFCPDEGICDGGSCLGAGMECDSTQESLRCIGEVLASCTNNELNFLDCAALGRDLRAEHVYRESRMPGSMSKRGHLFGSDARRAGSVRSFSGGMVLRRGFTIALGASREPGGRWGYLHDYSQRQRCGSIPSFRMFRKRSLWARVLRALGIRFRSSPFGRSLNQELRSRGEGSFPRRRGLLSCSGLLSGP